MCASRLQLQLRSRTCTCRFLSLPRHMSTSTSTSTSLRRLPLYYSSDYTVELPPKHRFPMERYRKTYHELLARTSLYPHKVNVIEPRLATIEEITLAHTPNFVSAFCSGRLSADEQQKIGFPWSASFVTRTLRITGGSIQCLENVLSPSSAFQRVSVACNMAGGTHHAYSDHGEGFCIFNDIAIISRLAQQQYGIKRILIIDLDVHQGNGTTSILQHDTGVYTFSMHGRHNYPFVKEHSNCDVELEDGCDDITYMTLLQQHLPRIMNEHKPELVIYQAGVDPLSTDRLGRLKLTRNGLRQRNAYVFQQCHIYGHIPVVVTMGGGYSRPIESSCEAHVDVWESAVEYGMMDDDDDDCYDILNPMSPIRIMNRNNDSHSHLSNLSGYSSTSHIHDNNTHVINHVHVHDTHTDPINAHQHVHETHIDVIDNGDYGDTSD